MMDWKTSPNPRTRMEESWFYDTPSLVQSSHEWMQSRMHCVSDSTLFEQREQILERANILERRKKKLEEYQAEESIEIVSSSPVF